MPIVRFDDASAGLWIPGEPNPTTEQAGFEAPQNALLEADNLDFLPNGAIRGRRGSSKFNASAAAGEIRAIGKLYIPPNTEERHSSASPNSSVEGSNLDLGGTRVWHNPRAGLQAADESPTRVDLGAADVSRYLYFQPFIGIFNPVPPDATLTRIEVRVIRKRNEADVVRDRSIQLVTDVGLSGTDKADTGTDWPVNYETAAYGASGDPDPLWGLPFSPTVVNAFSFGVAIQVNAPSGSTAGEIDFIEMIIFFTTSAGDKMIVAFESGANVQYAEASGGTFTNITGGLVAGSQYDPRIVAWSEKQKLFLFDGDNPLSQYDGDEITEVPTSTFAGGGTAGSAVSLPPRRGPYAALHKSRLYATDPSEIAGSVYACEINDETAWLPDAHLNVSDSDGGRITGLASFGDYLIILKDTSIFAAIGDPVTGIQLLQISDLGCVAPDSVAVTPFGVVYVGRAGVYLTDGRDVTPLSFAVRSLFVARSSETVFADASGVYFPRREQYWLKLDPAEDELFILHRVTIPTEDGTTPRLAWSRIPTCPMNVGLALPGAADNGELYLGDTDGFLWLRDTGSDDAGTAYRTRTRTVQRLFEAEERRMGRVAQVFTLVRASEPYDVELWYDQTVIAPLGFTMGATTTDPEYRDDRYFVPSMDAFGRYIAVAITGAENEGADFEATRVDLDVFLRTRRVWR